MSSEHIMKTVTADCIIAVSPELTTAFVEHSKCITKIKAALSHVGKTDPDGIVGCISVANDVERHRNYHHQHIALMLNKVLLHKYPTAQRPNILHQGILSGLYHQPRKWYHRLFSFFGKKRNYEPHHIVVVSHTLPTLSEENLAAILTEARRQNTFVTFLVCCDNPGLTSSCWPENVNVLYLTHIASRNDMVSKIHGGRYSNWLDWES